MKVNLSKQIFFKITISLFAALALSLLLYQFESLSLAWAICIGFGTSIVSYFSSRTIK